MQNTKTRTNEWQVKNIVGTNTYVYRFVMAWLNLLDHFLFHSRLAVYRFLCTLAFFSSIVCLCLCLCMCMCVQLHSFMHFFFTCYCILANIFVRCSVSLDILFACLWTGSLWSHFSFGVVCCLPIRSFFHRPIVFYFFPSFGLHSPANTHFAKLVYYFFFFFFGHLETECKQVGSIYYICSVTTILSTHF